MRLLHDWMDNIPLQQQAVLVMACRGFDGTTKHSPHKPLVRTIRAHCLVAARYGRPWTEGDGYSDFMTLDYITDQDKWNHTCEQFITDWDSYNVHAALHLIHAVEVLGYKHPNVNYRERWCKLYFYVCDECLHMEPETPENMDARLNDWAMLYWEPKSV